MPCSTSSRRRSEPDLPSANSRSWRSEQLVAEREQGRLALLLAALEARGGIGLDRGEVHRTGGQAEGVLGHAGHHVVVSTGSTTGGRLDHRRGRLDHRAGQPEHPADVERAPDDGLDGAVLLGLVEPQALREPGLGQDPQGRGVAVVGRGEVRRGVGEPAPGPQHPRPEHPDPQPATDPRRVADQVVDADRVRVRAEHGVVGVVPDPVVLHEPDRAAVHLHDPHPCRGHAVDARGVLRLDRLPGGLAVGGPPAAYVRRSAASGPRRRGRPGSSPGR